MSRRKTLAIAFAFVVFSFCAWYIATSFVWDEIGAALLSASLPLILIGGSISILVYWGLRTLRWRVLLSSLNIAVPAADLYFTSAVSLGFSIITPFQSGEMVKVELLRKYGHIERFPGYSSFVVERVFDLITVFLLAALSLCWRPLPIIDRTVVMGMLAVLTVLFFTALLVVRRTKFNSRLEEILSHVRACTKETTTLVLVALLSILSWLVVVAGWYICLLSVHVQLSFGAAVMLTSVTTLLNILSMIPGAVGVSEAGISFLLIQLGIASGPAQTGALILRVFGLMILVLGVIHFLIWRRLRARG